MKKLLLLAIVCALVPPLKAAPRFADQFVWIFGWDLDKDRDVTEISKVLETAGKNHFNGAVFSLGLDTLSKKSPDFFRRLDARLPRVAIRWPGLHSVGVFRWVWRRGARS